MPAIHRFVDSETSHILAIKLAKQNLIPHVYDESQSDSIIETTVWGINFKNPIGLAAGFDKDGEAVEGLSKLGFGLVEVGSVTPLPQPGNDRPRVFRLIEEKAVINRYGFNSSGHQAVKENLQKQFSAGKKAAVVGLNLGKNKTSLDATADYVTGLSSFKDCSQVDYFVINISSPNTPGLRSLQAKEHLEKLVEGIVLAKELYGIDKPLLIKISPDLSMDELKAIADIVFKYNKKPASRRIDGLIISNTTTSRSEELLGKNPVAKETGGLSGRPLTALSSRTISLMYKLTGGSVPIVGVGGIFTGQDAYDKIKAGASLLQIYSSLALEGPPVVRTIKRDLAALLRENGFSSVKEAVGSDNK
jgi:dihydroorotate dehydrogenase